MKFIFFVVLIFCFNVYSQNDLSKGKKIIPEYQEFLDASNNLHLHSYKDENLEYVIFNQKNLQNGKTLTYYSNDKLQRVFFDENFSIEYIEKWNIKETVDSSYLEKVSFYKKSSEDENLSFISKQKYNLQITEYDLINKKMTDFFYDEKNQLLEKNEFLYINIQNEKISLKELKEKKNRHQSSFVAKYDSFDRTILEEEIDYIYKYDNSINYRKKNSRKNVFTYDNSKSNNKIPSVVNFYEDEILRIKTVYQTKDSYVQNIYFDDDMFVKVQYIDGKKVSEVFSIVGVEVIQK